MTDLPRFAADADPADVAAAVAERGVAVVERLAPDELCDRVAHELAPWIEATPAGTDDFAGRATRRTGGLLGRSPSSAELVAHPTVLGVCDRVLWESRTTYQLHLTQAITIGPGGTAQALHRDQWCFDFFPFPPDVQVEVSTIWALSDFTEENGATRVVPDSHGDVDAAAFTDADAVPAVMPRGSVVIYTGRTVHGGGANRSEADRCGVNVDYVLGFLRQEENQYLSVPADAARALPEPVQRLMGYDLGAFALGYVDDLRHPLEALGSRDRGASTGFGPG